MNIIFFDTETTGKPKNYKAHMTDVNNWPRVTQLAWQVYNLDGSMRSSRMSLIKPDRWEVPKEQFFIDHNMSTERCEAEGLPMVEVLDTFIHDIENLQVDMMVAHNIAFDYPVLGAEMIRYIKRVNRKLDKFCTMNNTTAICKLPGKFGHKWPTLTELHNFLFQKPFEGAHDALDDVRACSTCFFELLNRKLIKLPVYA